MLDLFLRFFVLFTSVFNTLQPIPIYNQCFDLRPILIYNQDFVHFLSCITYLKDWNAYLELFS